MRRLLVLVFLMLPVGTALAEQADVRAFVDCLRDSGAKYYGAHWCPYCRKQNALFGKDAKYLPYVECSRKGSRDKLSRCDHISGYPTWELSDGRQVSGVQSISDLTRLTGCEVTAKNYFID
jgi:hypothetical protein